MVGSSEVIGSWKTRPMSPPRTLRMSAFDSPTRSRPPSSTWPAVITPPGGSSRMIELPSIDFPQPDSPTRPSVSPSATSRLTPSTACTVEPRSRISACRSLISSTLTWGAPPSRSRGSPEPDIQQVAQRVAEEVEGDDDDHDEHSDRVDLPPVTGVDVARAVRQHAAPGRGGRRQAEAQVAEHRQDQDG